MNDTADIKPRKPGRPRREEAPAKVEQTKQTTQQDTKPIKGPRRAVLTDEGWQIPKESE